MDELVKAGRVGPDTARFQLHDLASPCDLWCRFCPRSLDARRPEPAPAAVQHRVREAFARFLAERPERDVVLLSSDILAWPDLFALLDLARDAGRRVTLLTPGLRLHDEALVDRLAAYPVRFDLTWLSARPETHLRITRHEGGHAALVAALGHLRARGLPFRLSTVLTEDNVAELPEIARSAVAHGVRHLTVRLFWPDRAVGRRDYDGQFPAFADLRAALRDLASAPPDPVPTIELTNVPLCQVDLAEAEPVPVFVRPTRAVHNSFRAEGLPACATCPERDRCVRVHPGYRHDLREPDLDAVGRNAVHSEAILDRARREAGPGGVRTEGWVVPGQG